MEAPAQGGADHQGLPALSILIEWENVLVAAEDRCARMLRELGRQVGAFAGAAEILVLFNPEQIRESAVAEVLAKHLCFEPRTKNVPVRVLAAPGMHYYDLRNHGARLAQGEIIVCLDSDVIPEPGWLNALTSPILADTRIDFVGGETHLDHAASFFDKAFALGWIFPPRSSDDALRPGNARQFWANNLACRRSFFLEHPYPTDPNNPESRNACRRLRQQLEAKGVTIWRAGAARVSHPAPNGWRKAFLHALVEGRDNAIIYRDRGYGPVRRSLRAVDFAFGRLKQAVRNGLDRTCSVRVPVWQLPGVILILIPYYTTTIAGAWAHAWLPARVWGRWTM